jgi:hypothetical protein
MKNLLNFFILVAGLVVVSCTQTEKNYVLRVSPHRLTVTEIYRSSNVKDFLFDLQEQNVDSVKSEGKELFLKGMDAYVNRHDPLEGIVLFKRSILSFPTANAYYEIGNAYKDFASNIDENGQAQDAYEMAEVLGFKPLSALRLKQAVVATRVVDNYWDEGVVFRRLIEAFKAGYRDTMALSKDKDLLAIKKYKEYNAFMREVRNIVTNIESTPFEVFIASFPNGTAEAFEIKPEQVGALDFTHSISYDFVSFIPEMQNVSFGREVSHEFLYVTALPSNEKYRAVIYTSVSYFGEDLQPIHTKLVTYDAEGKQIAAKIFAGQFSAEKVKAGAYANKKFTVTEYARKWELPIDKVSFEENKVKAYEVVGSASYVINDDGSITEEETKGNFRDSILLVKK